MECPVDRTALQRVEMEPGLPAFECATCSGHWMRFGDYLAWRDRQPGDRPETTSEGRGEIVVHATAAARQCPDCRHLLTRYTVGHGVTFTLDRCGNCNGIWLDAAEWALLRERGLHDDVHQIFGPGWQAAAKQEEGRRRTEAQFERQLGPDFERARDFADWLAAHPRRSEILAYIGSRVR